MQDEHELIVKLEPECREEDVAPVRVAPDDLEPDTLRAVIESFVLREGTDYGLHETSLDTKVAQVMKQLRRGEAQITFDPATESVNLVMTRAIGESNRA
ncbi:MAG TPA: YheU family protein [Vicinamibacterales bacterium]|nr:YheU family protein [Vicinamibacterales bacterium]